MARSPITNASDTEGQRVRKHHTRSRIGCITCKKRHVRCDANQPTCQRCLQRGDECSYGVPDLPLRERRGFYLPGEHRPWPVTLDIIQPVLPKRALQFNFFPIEMRFKSIELLKYFHRIHDNFDISSCARDTDVLRFLVHNPTSIRYTLIIAGIHYMWTTGDLTKYSSTVMFHKNETIGLLNKPIPVTQPARYITLVKPVATLCLLECGSGNNASAELHVNGLITILENYRPNREDDSKLEFHEEMAYRYFVLTFNYIHNMRSRIKESKDLRVLIKKSRETDMAKYFSLMQKIHTQDIGCLKLQLQAASMYPFFFPDLPPTTKFRDIDASAGVNALRSLTKLIQSTKFDHVVANPSWSWVEGSISRWHLAIMNSQVASLFGTSEVSPTDPISEQKLTTSWLSNTIANGFYLHSVLCIWNANEPMEQRLLRLVMNIFVRALNQEDRKANMYCSPDLWFWENFVGAYCLATHQQHARDSTLQWIEQYFDGEIRRWSQAFEVTLWELAQSRLRGIAWPKNHPQELCRIVWERGANYKEQEDHGPAD